MKLTYIERRIGGLLSAKVGDVQIECAEDETLTEAQATVVLLERIAAHLEQITKNTD